jgi:hypothetical protein
MNLGGTFSDGTILPERQINRQWDGPWDAVTRETDEGWVAEIWIPWSMMSLPQAGSTRRIGLYTERMVAARGETYSWPALPGTNSEYLSAFQKYELSGVNPATQFTFYPYSSATFDDMKNTTDYRVGADVYWRAQLEPAAVGHAESRLRHGGVRRRGGESGRLRDLLRREAHLLPGGAGHLQHLAPRRRWRLRSHHAAEHAAHRTPGQFRCAYRRQRHPHRSQSPH